MSQALFTPEAVLAIEIFTWSRRSAWGFLYSAVYRLLMGTCIGVSVFDCTHVLVCPLCFGNSICCSGVMAHTLYMLAPSLIPRRAVLHGEVHHELKVEGGAR